MRHVKSAAGIVESAVPICSQEAPAVAKVRVLRSREQTGEFLRVAISGGGCNGLSYKMRFVPEPKRGDIMVRNGSCYKCVNCGSTSGC